MSLLIARAQTLVRASPSSIYDAFVNADVMSKFWFTRRDRELIEGETVHWYIGPTVNAYAIEVRVKELIAPEKILIEWGDGQSFTQVQWQIEPAKDGTTRLTIEECGFSGSDDEIVSKALDSTGGFNQVVIALKTLLEHDKVINIVADHS